MNTDYIRVKAHLLRGCTVQERDCIIASIGVCAGLLPAREQNAQLSAHKRQEIQSWLKHNAVRLKLPQQPQY